jgi:hypothetical protein
MDYADALASADVLVRQKLGGDITYTPGVGDAVTVSGIFTAPHTNVDLGEQGGGINTVSPTVFLTLSELPSDPSTDTDARVTVGGVDYRWDTNSAEPDGMGGVLLRLHRDD